MSRDRDMLIAFCVALFCHAALLFAFKKEPGAEAVFVPPEIIRDVEVELVSFPDDDSAEPEMVSFPEEIFPDEPEIEAIPELAQIEPVEEVMFFDPEPLPEEPEEVAAPAELALGPVEVIHDLPVIEPEFVQPERTAPVEVAPPFRPRDEREVALPSVRPPGGLPASDSARTLRTDLQYRREVTPVYPRSARQQGQEGEGILILEIDERGRVREVELKHSSGFALLDRAAMDAARRCLFHPARIGNQAVASHVERSYRFVMAE
jgi:periplasmic protein TonB